MTRVTYEQAKELKSAGFDVPVGRGFIVVEGHSAPSELDWGIDNYNRTITKWDMVQATYSAPALHTVCDWLREVKGLHVMVDIYNGGWAYTITQIKPLKQLTEQIDDDTIFYDSHDSALSAAIDYVLTILNKTRHD